ncbi:MAG: MauE/DoxX family redox-associated membrane protein [Pseudomonadota bacterium]|nr:DoxX family membrane protein [Pseudomonadota bacterium]MBU1571222.1 DoxX family membrane protein [Pseudomonadota bacterium]
MMVDDNKNTSCLRCKVSIFFRFMTSWLPSLIRIGLGMVFVYAGIIKLMDPKDFARIISQYDLLPELFLPVAAIGLPLLELLAGIGLILSIRGSLSLVFTLLIFFIAILRYGILKDLNVDCGCFSGEELKGQAGLWDAFYRDLIMTGAAVFLFYLKWIKSDRKNVFPLWAKIKQII